MEGPRERCDVGVRASAALREADSRDLAGEGDVRSIVQLVTLVELERPRGGSKRRRR